MKKIKKTKETKQSSKSEIIKRLEKTAWTLVKTVIDTTPTPFLILDPKLQVIAANKFFYQTFKVSPKETEGQLIYNLGKGQWNIPRLKMLLEEIIPKKTYFRSFEVKHNFPKIGEKLMLLNARQIYEKRGLPKTIHTPIILLIIEDITTLRKSQKKSILAKRRIKETKVKLEKEKEISKKKSEFVSLASHQLRTPLTSIKWYSEMLLKGEGEKELTPKQKKYIGELYQGNERMINLVRNLLNISRIEMGVLAVNPKPTDIEELLKKVIKEQEFFVQEKNMRLLLKYRKSC